MEWNQDIIQKLNVVFQEKYNSMFNNREMFDRKNRSALWNKYLKNYECKVIRNDEPGKKNHAVRANAILIENLTNLINFKNDLVKDSLIIPNPDRYGQYILISRDMCERILAIGMI